jgi:hypothetical protein
LSRTRRLLYWSILLGGLAVFAWGASVVARATTGYLYVKKQPPGWRGNVARADTRLGFGPVPASTGAEILPGGEREPVRFDAAGFRIPMDGSLATSAPRVLALGDSFTFGTGCRAEDTYAARVARGLGGHVLNAGFPGYGLSQMLVRGRELLPAYRPDLVLVQASTWLPIRAARPLRRSNFGLLPVPYFAAGDGGRPQWHQPLFTSKLFDLPIARYRETDAGPLDWASFVGRVGIPLFLHDDPRALRMRVARATGRLPSRASERAISDTVYAELARLCEENGARMVVVILESAGKHVLGPADFALPPGVLLVDTKRGLYARISGTDEDSYLRAYGHWRGSPPKMVDTHPNTQAHAIIAEQVLAALATFP